jgi:hypothetical protein
MIKSRGQSFFFQEDRKQIWELGAKSKELRAGSEEPGGGIDPFGS